MTEDLVRLGVFLVIGALLWAIAQRHPMPEYGRQPVASIDRWFFVVSILLAGLYGWLVAPVVMWVAAVADPLLEPIRVWSSEMHPALQVIAFLLATDFVSYWIHRLMHTRWVWNVHAFHHSARSLNWFSGMRGSPAHFALLLAPGTLMASLFLISHGPWIVIALAVLDALTQNLMHTNLRLPFARQLEWIIITPRMHFIHHHRDPVYGNSNFGFNLAIWDHLFGTYVDASAVKDKGQLGLDDNLSVSRLFLGIDSRPRTKR